MAGLISCFSSSRNTAFLVVTAFSFITVAEGRCFDCNSDQVCCNYDCVDGTSCVGYDCDQDQDCSSYEVESCCKISGEVSKQCLSGSTCLGQSCSADADCSFNQTCCDSKCVQGKSCLGRHCFSTSGCASGETCCSSKCKEGYDCLGESCSSYEDCKGEEEQCCEGKCSKSVCDQDSSVDLPFIIGLSVGVGAFTICMLTCIIRTAVLRQRRLRRLLEAGITTNITTTVTTREDGTEVITEEITTNFNSAPVTQSNPLYQPEGPQSDQPAQQPPLYTETPTGGPGGRDTHQSDSFAAAPHKTAGVV